MDPFKEEEDYLLHEGVSILDGAPGRGSGRWALGSGANPNQHSGDFYTRVKTLRAQGLSDKEIGAMMGMSSGELRAEYSNARAEKRNRTIARIVSLQDQGYSNAKIAEMLGLSGESTVRSIMKESSAIRANTARATADILRKQIEEKGMLDVGAGVERELGISREKLNAALAILQEEGYPVYGGGVPQVTNPGKQTNIKVVCPKGTPHRDIYDYDRVNSVMDYVSSDGGASYRKAFEYPESLSSKRIQVRYAEDGGVEQDGFVEIRRGVKDLSLGNSHYAQVRMKYMKDPKTGTDNTQNEMGKISNLITDMTIRGATSDELAAAVRHSMVVIDAAKHKLNYKQSEKDNNIAGLKRKYQERVEDGRVTTSASTLLSRAKNDKTVIKRQGQPRINQIGKPWYDSSLPEGALIYKTTDKPTYVDKNGKTVLSTQKSTQMAETRDARSLISAANTAQEILYADYANWMKAKANEARKEMIYTEHIKTSPEAKQKYAPEVASLKAKLNVALKNAPRERKAQLMANTVVKAKVQANPDMTKKEKKKHAQLALTEARLAVGAKRQPVEIADREWDAIQYSHQRKSSSA